MIAALVTGRLLEKPKPYGNDAKRGKDRISATLIANDAKSRATKITVDTGDRALVVHLARGCEGEMLSTQGEITVQVGRTLLLRPRSRFVLGNQQLSTGAGDGTYC